MTFAKNTPAVNIVFKGVIMLILVSLIAFSRNVNGATICKPCGDTLPPEQINKLNKNDIRNISMQNDSVKIRFKNHEELGMTQAEFDDLSPEVKKQLPKAKPVFTKVEIETAYPGGQIAWLQYLNRTFRYPQEAQKRSIQGTVVVEFIVDKEGRVSDVTAVSGPIEGGLREEAVRVIQNSGIWVPAVANGHPVKSYKRQSISFKLE